MDVQSNLVSYADKLEKLADEAAAEEPEGYGVCCTKSFGEGHDDDCPWLYWYRNQHPARGKLASLGFRVEGEQWSQVIPEGVALARKVAALVRALASLTDWRVDKAIEHLGELRQLAIDSGATADQVAFVERYQGWFINAQEKRKALAGIEGERE